MKQARRIRLGVLVSGRGSNLQAIIDAIECDGLSAEIVVVVANHVGALAARRAREHGIAVSVITRKPFPSRESQETAIATRLKEAEVDLVVCAGFDRVAGKAILEAFPGRILNIHPSLLPAFGGGLHAQEDALKHGVKVSGCTVHLVTADVDAGPIVIQRCVAVLENDTVESLSARILVEEHKALPDAIRLFAEGRILVNDNRVRILTESDDA